METTKKFFDDYKYDPNKTPKIIVNKSNSAIDTEKVIVDTADKPTIETLKQPELDISNLSEKQRIAYDKFIAGENLFITGPGGTGKTKLIKHFVDYVSYYEKEDEDENVKHTEDKEEEGIKKRR